MSRTIIALLSATTIGLMSVNTLAHSEPARDGKTETAVQLAGKTKPVKPPPTRPSGESTHSDHRPEIEVA